MSWDTPVRRENPTRTGRFCRRCYSELQRLRLPGGLNEICPVHGFDVDIPYPIGALVA